jgi:glycosyltransferase involved in cell wall biosynthesis
MNPQNIGKAKLTIIIPSRNRRDTLRRVLLALQQQLSVDVDQQVIVVDDDSNDGTDEMVRAFAQHTALRLAFYRLQVHNAGACRNDAVNRSQGELLLFLDADTIPCPGAVDGHVQFHERMDHRDSVLMGGLEEQVADVEQVRIIDWQIHSDAETPVDWLLYRTGNTSMPRELFNRAGGFCRELQEAEDSELAYRLSQCGARFYHDQSVKAMHCHPLTLAGYLEKARRYGESVSLWFRKNPELRRSLSDKYGVYCKEMGSVKKVKYFLRVLCINRWTAPFLLAAGKRVRNISLPLSQRLVKSVYRLTIRQTFRRTLGRLQAENRKPGFRGYDSEGKTKRLNLPLSLNRDATEGVL